MSATNSSEAFSSDSFSSTYFTNFVKAQTETQSAETNVPQTYFCDTCQIDCENLEKYETHCKGILHSSKTAAKAPTAMETVAKDGQDAAKQEKKVDNPASGNFECKLCNIRTTGSITFEAHLVGKAHQRKLKLAGLSESDDSKIRAQAQPVKVILKDVKGAAHLKPALTLLTTPTLGLQYIIEIRNQDRTIENRYLCDLCDSKCDPRTVTSHIIGSKHRLAYIKKHYPEHMEKIFPGGEKGKKSESTPLILKYSEEIQVQEGQKEVRVQTQVSQYAAGPNLSIKRTADHQGGPEAKRGAWSGGVSRGRGGGRQENSGPGGRGRGGMGGWKSEQPRGRGRGGWFSESGTGRGRGQSGHGEYFSNREPLVGRSMGQWTPRHSYPMHEESTAYDLPSRHEPNKLRKVLLALSDVEISTESDASLALEVSNALTQSLLNYRLKTVTTGPKSLVSALSKGLTAMSEAPSRMKTSFVSQDYDHGYAPNTGAGSGGNYNDYYDTPSSGNDMYMDNGSGYYDQSMYSSSHNMY